MELRQAELIQLDVPASYRYLRIIGECIAELIGHIENLPDRDSLLYGVQLAAHEVCTNIVGHAYNNDCEGRLIIKLTLNVKTYQLVMDFYDTGKPFDINTVQPPRLDEAQVHGYGLFIIHSLMDSVTYASHTDGNHWRLVKQLHPSE